jgi:hypothetical protein
VPGVTAVHELLGWASIAGSVAIVAVAIWSVIAGRRSDGRSDHRFAVDRAVLAVLVLLAAAGLAGIALVVSGSRPLDPLHLVYGPAALVCLPIAIWIGARTRAGRGSRLRQDVWTAGGGIVLLGLALRLLATG